MTKVGFLFIDQSYSVYHAISAAISFSQRNTIDVSIYCTPRNRKLIDDLLKEHHGPKVEVVTIRPLWFFTLPHYLEIKLQFRTVLFKKYNKELSKFDIIGCTIYEDLNLKKYFHDNNKSKFIFFNHGAVNRSYSFDQKITDFDLFNMSGNYERELRANLNQLTNSNNVVSGYLKHELLESRQKKRLFNNDKPVVVYNPHWVKKFSSFPVFGFQILDFFTTSDQYNLIFTPHTVLMVRNKSYYLKLLKYKKYKNILIDLGSEACNDMTYTKAADLYLGDASSQAWEFTLLEKRPCLFIDVDNLKDNPEEVFLSWELGEVIDNVSNLEKQINNTFHLFESKYKSIQVKKLKEMFHQPINENPSDLVVEAIMNLQEEKRPS